MRVTVTVDCDTLGDSPEERLRAGCRLAMSALTGPSLDGRAPAGTTGLAPLGDHHQTVVPGSALSAAVPAAGALTVSPSSRILFRGDPDGDGGDVRVRRLSTGELIAERRRPSYREEEGDAAWEATDDTGAMRAYEACIRSLLGDP